MEANGNFTEMIHEKCKVYLELGAVEEPSCELESI